MNRSGVGVASVRVALKTLQELGYVWRERNFDTSGPTPYQYRIADNAVAFWFRFVQANRSRLSTGATQEVWDHHVEPYLDGYMGKIFERMCREAYTRYHSSASRRSRPGRGSGDGGDGVLDRVVARCIQSV